MLFTAALESIFRQLPWETRGLEVYGKYLSHLRFADDILIFANTAHELQQMLQEIADESENQGFKHEQVEDKGVDGNRHTNMSTTKTDREC